MSAQHDDFFSNLNNPHASPQTVYGIYAQTLNKGWPETTPFPAPRQSAETGGYWEHDHTGYSGGSGSGGVGSLIGGFFKFIFGLAGWAFVIFLIVGLLSGGE